jgi:UDP-N-acetylmuramate dehydrogenase
MQIKHNFNLKEYNSYKIEATCAKAYFPDTENDFVTIFTERTNAKRIILGGGYNMLFGKSHYDNDFIVIGESFAEISLLPDGVIEVESGASAKTLSEFALENSLSGFEVFYDIPSSIGGAVVMNAGASGEDIKDVLVKVRYLDLNDMKFKEMSKEDIGFIYRNSFFQKNANTVVVKAWLQLKKVKAKEEIFNKMESIKNARWAKQPREFPNAGSVFKRPEGFYVGTMIEQLGLKGYTVGGAKISEKHAGFIVNFNKATGPDIIESSMSKIKLKKNLEWI